MTATAMRAASAGCSTVQNPALAALRVKLYADGAERERMLAMNADPMIRGMTTNPTLMNKAGIRDYEAFAKDILSVVREKPVSFEVFSDDFSEMHRQALKIQSWGANVYVKIPVSNTRGETSYRLVRKLADEGVKLNVTAILTPEQARNVAKALNPDVPAVVSVFAGRIADAGQDPAPIMGKAKRLLSELPMCELLWASVREVYNIFQADQVGCDIVTLPLEIMNKAIQMAGRDLRELSLETVKMFAGDAAKAGFVL